MLGLVTSVLVAWGAVVHVKLRPQGMSHMQTGVAVVDGVIQRVRRHRRFGQAIERWEFVDTAHLTFGADAWSEAAREIEAIGGAAYDQAIWAMAAKSTPPTPMPTITGRLDDLAAQGPPMPVPGIADVRTSLTLFDFGWPMPDLRLSRRHDSFASQAGSPGSPPGMGSQDRVRSALAIPWPGGGRSASSTTREPLHLPWMPRPGLAINTLVFAMFWGLALYAPGAARRAMRQTRGRCTACGYALKGQPRPGCPECGLGRRVRAS